MAKAKKVVEGEVKLQINPGSANPSPPIGPALGQKGVNIMEFCKAFNARTEDMDKTLPVPVLITVYKDKSFDFIIKTPPAAELIKQKLSIQTASATPNTHKVGKLTREQAEEIAEIKMPDLTAASFEAAVQTVVGSATSMGVEVEGVE